MKKNNILYPRVSALFNELLIFNYRAKIAGCPAVSAEPKSVGTPGISNHSICEFNLGYAC